MNSLIYISFVVLIFTSLSFAQVKYTWNNSAGSWQTASNWIPNGIPGTADTAVVNGGTVTNDSTVFVASLFQNGGRINGTGEINIIDSLSFTNGIQSGTGATKLLGGCNGVISSIQSKALSRKFNQRRFFNMD